LVGKDAAVPKLCPVVSPPPPVAVVVREVVVTIMTIMTIVTIVTIVMIVMIGMVLAVVAPVPLTAGVVEEVVVVFVECAEMRSCCKDPRVEDP
jgi:hypothetical protein